MTRQPHAHRQPRPSTFLTREPVQARPLPVRLDPDYDDPRVLDWRELLNPLHWLAATALLAAVIAFAWLMAGFVA